MIKRPDVNDTLRGHGAHAVQERYDNAQAYRGTPESSQRETFQPDMLPPPTIPMAVAREFVEQCGRADKGEPTIRHWRGGWWVWRQSHWREIDDREMRSMLYRYTERATYVNAKGDVVAWAPNRHRVGDLMEALSAVALLAADINQPTWLDGRNATTIVATANGLLDVEYQRLPLARQDVGDRQRRPLCRQERQCGR